MACLPGMPCYDQTAFPLQNSSSDCNSCCPVESNRVIYEGPNLPQSGINTGDCLTLAIEKIDEPMDLVEPMVLLVLMVLTVQLDHQVRQV
jgi:hypothetical protein